MATHAPTGIPSPTPALPVADACY